MLLVGAIAIRLAGLATPARDGLAFHFDAPPGGANQLVAILWRNLTVAAIPLTAAYTVPRVPAWRPGCDALLTLIGGGSVAVGSLALGAYGTALLRFAAPYGPLELAADAAAAATYLQARRNPPLSARSLAPAATAITAALIAAAVCETLWAGQL